MQPPRSPRSSASEKERARRSVAWRAVQPPPSMTCRRVMPSVCHGPSAAVSVALLTRIRTCVPLPSCRMSRPCGAGRCLLSHGAQHPARVKISSGACSPRRSEHTTINMNHTRARAYKLCEHVCDCHCHTHVSVVACHAHVDCRVTCGRRRWADVSFSCGIKRRPRKFLLCRDRPTKTKVGPEGYDIVSSCVPVPRVAGTAPRWRVGIRHTSPCVSNGVCGSRALLSRKKSNPTLIWVGAGLLPAGCSVSLLAR